MKYIVDAGDGISVFSSVMIQLSIVYTKAYSGILLSNDNYVGTERAILSTNSIHFKHLLEVFPDLPNERWWYTVI